MMSRDPRRVGGSHRRGGFTAKPKPVDDQPQPLTVWHQDREWTVDEFAAMAGVDVPTIRRKLIRYDWSAWAALNLP